MSDQPQSTRHNLPIRIAIVRAGDGRLTLVVDNQPLQLPLFSDRTADGLVHHVACLVNAMVQKGDIQ